MCAMGFKPDVIKWFRSYLTGRNQSVLVNGTMSEPSMVTCGVPQGSVLGPLLFMLYVNDMEAAVTCKLLLYADDSALLVSGKDISYIESVLSEELQNVSNWLVDNKLSLHLGKTESILFGSKSKLSKASELNVECNGTIIQAKPSVKYLGAEIDQNVSGEYMACNVIKKVSSRTKFLARKSRYLDKDTMKLLAAALVQCQLDYASTSWYSNLSKTTKIKLQICQNKLIRTVLHLPPRTHLDHSHFKELNWLPVESRVNQLRLRHVHQIVYNNCPKYLSNYFNNISNVHNIRTRSSQSSLFIPRFKSNIGKSSFKYTGAFAWNQLPSGAQTCVDPIIFKKTVKSFLLNSVLVQESSQYV
jgi:ribonuclease P/MRP protein subunit RPP40